MNKIIIVVILIFTGFFLFSNLGGPVKINMLIFLSDNCEICDDFQTSILPDLLLRFRKRC